MVKKTTTVDDEEYKGDENEKKKQQKRLLPLLRDAFKTDHCKINAATFRVPLLMTTVECDQVTK